MSLIDKSQRFSFHRPFADVYAAAQGACGNIKGMRVVAMDKSRPMIMLECGVTLWSWGETVTVECVPVSPDTTDVIITSQPKLSTTLFDYGKGKRNIAKVYEAISQYLLSR